MLNLWNGSKQYLIGGVVSGQTQGGRSPVEVASCSDGFRPESDAHISVLHHASCFCVKCSDHSLSNTILVLCIWW